MTRRNQPRWQVPYQLSFDEIPQVATENWSVWLDISIIVKTIPADVGRRGAS